MLPVSCGRHALRLHRLPDTRYHTIPMPSAHAILSHGDEQDPNPQDGRAHLQLGHFVACFAAICQGESLFGHLLMRLLLIPGREHLWPCPTILTTPFYNPIPFLVIQSKWQQSVATCLPRLSPGPFLLCLL